MRRTALFLVSLILLSIFIYGCGQEQAGEAFSKLNMKCPYTKIYCSADGKTLMKETADAKCSIKKLPTDCKYGCKSNACLGAPVVPVAPEAEPVTCTPSTVSVCVGASLVTTTTNSTCGVSNVTTACPHGCVVNACASAPTCTPMDIYNCINMNSSVHFSQDSNCTASNTTQLCTAGCNNVTGHCN